VIPVMLGNYLLFSLTRTNKYYCTGAGCSCSLTISKCCSYLSLFAAYLYRCVLARLGWLSQTSCCEIYEQVSRDIFLMV